MDLRRYYKAIKEKSSEIPELFVHVMSIESPDRDWKGGMVSEVTRENAAKHIVDGSHRLATPAEVEAFKTEQEQNRLKARDSEAARFGNILANRLNVSIEPTVPAGQNTATSQEKAASNKTAPTKDTPKT